MSQKRRNYLYLLLLILLSFIVYFRWLNINVLANADFPFLHDKALEELAHPSTWASVSDLGGFDSVLWRPSFSLVIGVLGALGAGFTLATRIVFLWAWIVLSIIPIFFLLRHFFKSNISIISGTLFFAFNTYFLSINTQGHVLLSLSASLAVLSLLLYIKLFEKPSISLTIASALSLFLTSIYDIRFTYIAIAIVLLRWAYCSFMERSISISRYKFLMLSMVLFGVLSVYWLIPMAASGGGISGVTARGLFGDQFWNLQSAFALFHPFWTGGEPTWFMSNSIPIYFWLLPIMAILGAIYTKRKSEAYYFTLLVLLGVFLTKQSDAPFGSIYGFLYSHLPGFDGFREATKFFFLTALGYAFLLACFTEVLVNKTVSTRPAKIVKYAVVTGVLLLFTSNTIPLVNGKINTMFKPKIVSNDYVKLENYVINQQEYFRTIWLPVTPKWAYKSNLNPSIGLWSLIEGKWAEPLGLSPGLSTSEILSYLAKIPQDKTFETLATTNAIKYFVVPTNDPGNGDDFFKYYGDNRTNYTELLDRSNFLKKIDIGTKELTVYENRNYRPYITSSTRLTSIPDLSHAHSYYEFDEAIFGQHKTNKIVADKKNRASSAPIELEQDLFEGIKPANMIGGMLNVSHSMRSGLISTLYADVGRPEYSYKVADKVVTFTAKPSSGTRINGRLRENPTSKVTSVNVKLDRYYVLSLGNVLLDLDSQDGAERNIGSIVNPLKLYSLSSTNLVKNGSFEDGLWRDRMDDCNNYGSKPMVEQAIADDYKTSGKNSLKLSARRHTACTSSSPMSVVADQEYSLQYDYRIIGAERASYELAFNDPSKTTLSADQINGNGRWNKLRIKFKSPVGADSMTLRLKGYSEDRLKTVAYTYYDSVQIVPLKFESDISGNDYNPTYNKIDLGQSEQLKLEVPSLGYDYRNTIPNPSLENGLWQTKVGDCNAYDDRPKLSMRLDQSNKAEGRQSLRLGATSHVACTGPGNIPVLEGSTYLLNFDYQSSNAREGGYNIGFDDANAASIGQRIAILSPKWQTYTKVLRVPYGAKNLNLSVYSYADESGYSENIVRYDNFSLTRIPDVTNRYYLISTSKKGLTDPKKITFSIDSQTKKMVHISGATTGFYLNMSESYNSGWRLALNDTKVAGLASWSPRAKPTTVPDKDHFNLNGFLNSWYVDPAVLCKDGSSACTKNADGSYDIAMIAEFAPQRWFYAGLVLSGTTLVGCIGFLIFHRDKVKKYVLHGRQAKAGKK